jgi:universal stress protein E
MVATDLQAPSLTAVRWSARYFVDDGGELLIVHVVASELDRAGAEETLSDRMADLGVLGARVEVRVGDPADEIVRAAADHAAELIVLGEHADRTGVGRLLGQTGASVARRAEAPVLVARDIATGAPRSLLVALHESPAVPQLLAWVERLATRFSASVTAIHVVPPSTSMPLMSSGLGVDTDRALEPLVDTTERWLETTVAGLRGRVESLTTSVAFGDPATEIMAADARVGADLVVIGRGGVGRLVGRLLDGTTQRVLRVGDSALLIVPAARAPAH